AGVAPAEAVDAILSAMDGGATERPALRRALARAVQRSGSDAPLDRVAAFVERSPSPAAAAAAALALGRTEAAQPVAGELVRNALDRAERFEDRWRLVAATASLAPDDAVDRWLVSTVREAPEWMLRAAALDALVARDAARAGPAAEAALEDDYPRVRARAAAALGEHRDHLVAVATLARRDPWPLVRQEGVRALADHPEALPVLRAAVHDPAAAVRRTAIATLTEVGDREAWGRVRKRLGDAGDDRAVRSAGIEFARRLCIEEAVGELGAIVDEGLSPDATPGQHDLAAEAVRALTALGGPEAGAVLERAGDERAPALLRTTVGRAREHEPRCRE
ncbi:MAG: HEAT repeat domain-containing protein, partial [Myxococcota bacterium]